MSIKTIDVPQNCGNILPSALPKITEKSRRKFRAWSSAVNKLNEQTLQKEAKVWMESAFEILKQNGK